MSERTKFGNILILDDEKININIIQEALAEKHNIYYALNYKTALEILKRIEINLILLDIIMPDITGYDFMDILKKNEDLKDIPVILITAKTDSESILKGFEHGCSDYITKPFEIPELQARVNIYLEFSETTKKLLTVKKFLEEIHEKIQHLPDDINSNKTLIECLKELSDSIIKTQEKI